MRMVSMSCCMETLSPPEGATDPCLVLLMLLVDLAGDLIVEGLATSNSVFYKYVPTSSEQTCENPTLKSVNKTTKELCTQNLGETRALCDSPFLSLSVKLVNCQYENVPSQ